MTSQYSLVEASRIRRIYVRSWRPGDGLTCAYTKAAPNTLPCGQPVAVSITEDARDCHHAECRPKRREWCEPRSVRRVVCINHIPTLKPPSSVTAEAKRAALERLAAAHWDEWQQYLAEAIEEATTSQLEFADPEIKRIVQGSIGGAA